MRKAVILLVILLAGCTQPPATFKAVEFPAESKTDWILSGNHVPTRAEGAGPAKFAEEPGQIVDIRVTASPEDFYGSKLFDGFDFLLQPLDEQDRPVRKLGSMTATLYRFEGDTYSGKGEKLLEWSVSAARMSRLWGESGVDRGYHMKLAWDRRPMVGDVRMEVRFVTQDGKEFAKVVSAGSVEQPRYRWLEK